MAWSNETLQTIVSRRSIRSFEPTPVSRETLEQVIEMGTYAPSPFNNQPWRFIVIQKKETIEEIARLVDERIRSIENDVRAEMLSEYREYRKNATFFKDTPALIIALLKPMKADAKVHQWGVPGLFSYEREVRGDIMCIGAACQNIMLAAESLGLATCMMLYPLIANEPVRELLDIRPPWHVMAYLPVGRAQGPRPKTPPRRDMRKIVQFI